MNSAHIPSPDDLLCNVPDLTSTTERIGFRAIAHGGYSDIWRGIERSEGTRRKVVIKIIRFASRDEVNIDRIEKGISREVIAWRSLNHINILPFYGLCWLFGYGQHRLPSLVFPYCEAGTCLDYLKGHPNADRTSIVRQVAGALYYLHALDPPVVHGDVKAASLSPTCNILMQNDGTPMLSDFGLSRVMMEGPTGLTTSSIRGSCRWMAPELFGDDETDTLVHVSKESDVWAFGCLCLEVLWDTVPWASIKTDPCVIFAVASKRQLKLPEGVESTALGRIVQRCWAYKAEDRPNMAQLLFALLVGTLESTSNQLLSNPDPIVLFFRSVQERNQIQHYCNTSTMLTMAVPSQVNPILAVNLPLVLSTPPPLPGLSLLDPNAGGSPATEALRLSLLGVGAIHQAYVLARSVGTDMSLVKVPQDGSADDLMNLAISYRLEATRALAVACQTIEGTPSDAALGASVTIALIDIFAGGHSWQSNMMLAKTLVSLRGGPGAIVAHNQPAHKLNLGDLTLSPARLFLEILTVYEVCGSFTSNEPPQLLGPGNSDWWISQESDLENYHSYSVENVFGISRRMVELMARVSTLVIRPTQFLASISEAPVDSPLTPVAAMGEEAQRLYQEVENWIEPPLPEVLRRRVENGNTAYRFAMQIMLLRDAFRVPRTDYRVQKAAHTIIECCFECTKYMGMGVALIWPVIIAGCQITSPERSWVTETFEGFRKHCCFEIDTAEQIVCEVWRREDEGLPKASWRSVIADLNLHCLLI